MISMITEAARFLYVAMNSSLFCHSKEFMAIAVAVAEPSVDFHFPFPFPFPMDSDF